MASTIIELCQMFPDHSLPSWKPSWKTCLAFEFTKLVHQKVSQKCLQELLGHLAHLSRNSFVENTVNWSRLKPYDGQIQRRHWKWKNLQRQFLQFLKCTRVKTRSIHIVNCPQPSEPPYLLLNIAHFYRLNLVDQYDQTRDPICATASGHGETRPIGII